MWWIIAGGLLFLAFFAAGCACCGCTVYSDTFTRADSTNLGADWTEVSGDWSISSNDLVTASSSAIAIYEKEVAAANGLVVVEYDLRYINTIRIIGAYTDPNNYIFLELADTAGGTNAALYSRSGGTNTLLEESDATVVDYTSTVYLYWNGVSASASFGAQSTSPSNYLTGHTTVTGTKAGVGTGTAGATTAKFISITVGDNRNVHPCTLERSCIDVCTDALPDSIEVTLPASWTDLGSSRVGCTTCDETFNNAVFVLDKVSNVGIQNGGAAGDISDVIGNCLLATQAYAYRSCLYYYDYGTYCTKVVGTTKYAKLKLYAWFEISGTTRTLNLRIIDYGDLADWFQDWASAAESFGACASGTWTLDYVRTCDGGDGLGNDLLFDSCDFNYGSPGTVSAEAA